MEPPTASEAAYHVKPMDITRSTIELKATYKETAEDLLSRYPGVDRSELLVAITASYFMDFRGGNKREERAACDFLNELQRQAALIQRRNAQPKEGELKL